MFGPQKGATPAQIRMLTGRLNSLAQQYRGQFGVDVSEIPGSGRRAASPACSPRSAARCCPASTSSPTSSTSTTTSPRRDLVVTGEGHLDEQSFEGKVVGGVMEVCAEHGVPVAAVVGIADAEVRDRLPIAVLADEFGEERSLREPLWCVERAARGLIERMLG